MPWLRTTRHHPCPICNKPDWCTFTEDGELVRCMRPATGGRPCRGGGKLFAVADANGPRRSHAAAKTPQVLPDHTALWRQRLEATPPAFYETWARRLGVTADALRRLGTFGSPHDPNLRLAAQRHGGRITGIQVRDTGTGRWCEPTIKSLAGAFVPSDLATEGILFITEGATSTAALLSIGLDAIGFWSSSVEDHVLPFVTGRDVVIIGDRDDPGIQAAARLAQRAPCHGAQRVRVTCPPHPHNDARDWVRAGATADDVYRRLETAREPSRGPEGESTK